MKILYKLSALFLLLLTIEGSVLAASGTGGIALSTITTNINTTVTDIARILTDISLIVGISFILSSFFKFHQHKLNPTQVPVSQGVTLLLIGTALTLFVVMIPSAKQAIFGSAAISKVGGSDMSTLIGGSST